MGESDRRRVVVTGMGAITPVGADVGTTWAALVAGRSGAAAIGSFDAAALPVRIAAEVTGFSPVDHFGVREARHLDRFAQFALVAARQALAESGLVVRSCPGRVGVVFASGIGGIRTLAAELAVLAERGPRRVSPFLVPMMMGNGAAAQIAMETGAAGPSSCVTTACSASADAIGHAADLIRLGRADAVIAGGAEANITPICLAAFAQMRALSTRNADPAGASRPFDAGRDGFLLAEGAAAMVLEERGAALDRGAVVLAELVGYGSSSDAYHVTAPLPSGAGAAAAMQAALADAGLDATAIGYVNAHGTSTALNDRVESVATAAVLGEHVPVSSTKSVTGHLMGAAGALEAVVCVQVLETGVLPPNINLDEPDPECRLDLVANVARTAVVEVAMTNSFGFGGHNSSLVFRRP